MQKRMLDLPTTHILTRVDKTDEHWIIKLEKNGVAFKSGQYVTVGVNGLERPYSIVSAPDEPFIELFLERVPPPEGQLTPVLYELHPGATVTMRPRAKGLFTMEMNYPNQLMVSTVTGIAPFVSMLRHYLSHGLKGNKFAVLHGGSFQNELVYGDEIQMMQVEHPDLVRYVPSVSRPNDDRNKGWVGDTGRVNALLGAYIESLQLKADNTIIYVCGHPGMIEDVKEKFMTKGWKVKEERYWKD